MKLFKKILVANRGEIAARIIKTAKKMGIETVAIYASDDKNADYVSLADEKYVLIGDNLHDTYLNIAQIIHIAEKSGSDGIHPGYGFLSENSFFSEACQDAGIKFIGPSPQTIHLMGNKVKARNVVNSLEIPVIKGVTGRKDELVREKEKYRYPAMIKAAAGGGGRGMRIVNSASELEPNLEAAEREALAWFNNPEIFIEQYIVNPRHIEVQILGDQHGNVVHLFERECSLQRNHQKIIEEAPSPTIDQKKRNEITGAAVKIAKEVGYEGAGTVEFILDNSGNYYFLEMNTRIQVEHTVTEEITGIDIVEKQFLIASGFNLLLLQSAIKFEGHAIQCRVCAEDPLNNFTPSPGKITYYKENELPGIRIDSAFSSEGIISEKYDTMISKIIARGNNRKEAILKIKEGLDSYHIHGITHNIPFLRNLIDSESFKENKISTQYIENNYREILDECKMDKASINKEILAAAYFIHLYQNKSSRNPWSEMGYWRIHKKLNLSIEKELFTISNDTKIDGEVEIQVNNNKYTLMDIKSGANNISFGCDKKKYSIAISISDEAKITFETKGIQFPAKRPDYLNPQKKYAKFAGKQKNGALSLKSPLFGKILKIQIKEGDTVKEGQELLILESMKMENILRAEGRGKIKSIEVKEGQQVKKDIPLIIFE